MNIKDFSKNYQSQNNNNTKNTNSNPNYEDIINQNSQQASNLNDTLNRYKDLSNQDLMSELMKEATKLKQNGSLNEDSLNLLKSTLSPMLTAEQNQQLDNIINMIK